MLQHCVQKLDYYDREEKQNEKNRNNNKKTLET